MVEPLRITHEVLFRGRTLTETSRGEFIEFTPDSEEHTTASNIVVPDDYGVVTLWDSGDVGLTDFSIAFLVTDKPLVLELHSSGGNRSLAIKLVADVPYYIHGSGILTSNSGSIVSDGSETTDFDSVDRIRVQRNVADGNGDASVNWYIFE